MPAAVKMLGSRAVRKSPTVSSPYFTKTLDSVTVKALGSSVSLECHVEGYPKPDIVWQKSGRLLGKSRNVHMTRTGNRCILEISSIREADLGLYECLAVNIVGTAITRAAVSQTGDTGTFQSKNVLKLPKTEIVRSRSTERQIRSLNSARSPSCSRRFGLELPKSEKPRQEANTSPDRLPRNSERTYHKGLATADPRQEPSRIFRERIVNKLRIPDIFKGSSNANDVRSRKDDKAEPPQKNRGPLTSTVRLPGSRVTGIKISRENSKSPSSLRKCITTNSSNIVSVPSNSATNSDHCNKVSECCTAIISTLPKNTVENTAEKTSARPKSPKSTFATRSHLNEDSSYGKSLAKIWPELRSTRLVKTTSDSSRICNADKRIPRSNHVDQLAFGNSEMSIYNDDRDQRVNGGGSTEHSSNVITCETAKAEFVPPVNLPEQESRNSDGTVHVNDALFRNSAPFAVAGDRRPLDIEIVTSGVSKRADDISHDDDAQESMLFVPASSTPGSSRENLGADDFRYGCDKSCRDVSSVPEIHVQKTSEDQDNEVFIDSEKDGLCLDHKDVSTDNWPLNTPDERCSSPMTADDLESLASEYVNGSSSSGDVGVNLDAESVKSADDLRVARPAASIPARINRGPQSVTVLRGECVTLAILFSGRPQPSVIWMKGGTILHDGARHSILVGQDMSALSVRDVTADDSGKYVVCVENDTGGDSCFASVAVVGIPEPPGGEPTASEFTDHSLVLSWYGSMYDGGSVVTGYVVEMCEVPEMKWQKVTSCVNTSCEVQGLCCGQQYIFRVRAENRYGVSHPSRESQTICLDDYIDGEAFRDENVETQNAPVTVEPGALFGERYEMKEEVGKGRFGTVFRCVEKSTGRPRAAKIIRCIKGKDKVFQEIDIMNRLHHPKLLKLLAAFESGRNMILITEFISGGELFERVIAHDFVLTECDCVLFMRQICDAIAYMHECSVLHLDLKPENILCKTRTSHQIKIIDFGLAKALKPEENLRVLFGTPEFVAPEVISYEPVGPPSDMWSVGVICYVLLSGLSPFMGDTDNETFANITRAEVEFDEEAFANISKEARDFISKLLIKLPRRRMSAEDSLKHPWLMRMSWMNENQTPLSTEKLKKFIIRRKWQKSGNAIRALGRMVSMSKSSLSSACETPSPVGSPPPFRTRLPRSETTDSGDSEGFRDSESIDLSR